MRVDPAHINMSKLFHLYLLPSGMVLLIETNLFYCSGSCGNEYFVVIFLGINEPYDVNVYSYTCWYISYGNVDH